MEKRPWVKKDLGKNICENPRKLKRLPFDWVTGAAAACRRRRRRSRLIIPWKKLLVCAVPCFSLCPGSTRFILCLSPSLPRTYYYSEWIDSDSKSREREKKNGWRSNKTPIQVWVNNSTCQRSIIILSFIVSSWTWKSKYTYKTARLAAKRMDRE